MSDNETNTGTQGTETNGSGMPDASTPVADTPVKKTSWLRRYVALSTVLGLALIAYIVFFGEKSVTQRIEYQRTIDSLEVCLRAQQDSLEYYRDLNRRLSTDPALMEQVVREQYNMKRPNEDVYVFE
ncbi:MAG: septum formation initiator family protein [Muribaculaceae bacterium]|nr:septum formation initiator family protein [Muribaculaceae bacterium]